MRKIIGSLFQSLDGVIHTRRAGGGPDRTLVEQAHSPKGVHFASFARDGEVRTGSFATKPPSEDELALRQRQAEGRW